MQGDLLLPALDHFCQKLGSCSRAPVGILLPSLRVQLGCQLYGCFLGRVILCLALHARLQLLPASMHSYHECSASAVLSQGNSPPTLQVTTNSSHRTQIYKLYVMDCVMRIKMLGVHMQWILHGLCSVTQKALLKPGHTFGCSELSKTISS